MLLKVSDVSNKDINSSLNWSQNLGSQLLIIHSCNSCLLITILSNLSWYVRGFLRIVPSVLFHWINLCTSSPLHALHPPIILIWSRYGFTTMASLVLVVEHKVQLPYRCQIWNADIYYSSYNTHGYYGSYVARKTTLWLYIVYISSQNSHLHHDIFVRWLW